MKQPGTREPHFLDDDLCTQVGAPQPNSTGYDTHDQVRSSPHGPPLYPKESNSHTQAHRLPAQEPDPRSHCTESFHDNWSNPGSGHFNDDAGAANVANLR